MHQYDKKQELNVRHKQIWTRNKVQTLICPLEEPSNALSLLYLPESPFPFEMSFPGPSVSIPANVLEHVARNPELFLVL